MNAIGVAAVCLVGHPYAPIGMGEHVRMTFRAMRTAGLAPTLSDLYAMNDRESPHLVEFSPYQTDSFGRINVWHVNGDELAQALPHTATRRVRDSYNVIYPAWELSRYPSAWARQLEAFDEIWAPSLFIQDSIARAVTRPVVHMPLACQVVLDSFLGRRHFGIRESAFAFLFYFDVRSFQSRKNPEAVLDAFEQVAQRRPGDDLLLVLKQPMVDNEVKNLVRCCDAFVSLHRSEGFGRGLAEAMCLAKPVVATAYSGNMDFCDETTALLVPFRLVDVPEGAYPYAAGQVWAEPDISAAVRAMERLLDDPTLAGDLGRRAAISMRTGFGLRVAGARFRDRLEVIQNRTGQVPSSLSSGVQRA
jgi:glycosyltransferase involved in cell wall biosynthesis